MLFISFGLYFGSVVSTVLVGGSKMTPRFFVCSSVAFLCRFMAVCIVYGMEAMASHDLLLSSSKLSGDETKLKRAMLQP